MTTGRINQVARDEADAKRAAQARVASLQHRPNARTTPTTPGIKTHDRTAQQTWPPDSPKRTKQTHHHPIDRCELAGGAAQARPNHHKRDSPTRAVRDTHAKPTLTPTSKAGLNIAQTLAANPRNSRTMQPPQEPHIKRPLKERSPMLSHGSASHRQPQDPTRHTAITTAQRDRRPRVYTVEEAPPKTEGAAET